MLKRKKSLKYQAIGLLVLRVGIGVMFILHGYPKLFGGPEMWEQVGSKMQTIGIDILPVAFGFLAGITECFGGLCLVSGLFFRPALGFLIVVMAVAASTHIAGGDPFSTISHSIEMAIVFIGLLFIGPGKYSLSNRLIKHRRRL